MDRAFLGRGVGQLSGNAVELFGLVGTCFDMVGECFFFSSSDYLVVLVEGATKGLKLGLGFVSMPVPFKFLAVLFDGQEFWGEQGCDFGAVAGSSVFEMTDGGSGGGGPVGEVLDSEPVFSCVIEGSGPVECGKLSLAVSGNSGNGLRGSWFHINGEMYDVVVCPAQLSRVGVLEKMV
ncbi:hypothetical protein NDU88_004656 [Pleurodeles waltl]|uniref:Uncharacterized protein n=1 Tax=Pleurodeles waltl TaxID=8319 RepID=A0AAV7SJG4_PLEWA|nr:hypothetical protein NDU88_004656 [Pleurodeles waltl]